MKNLLVSPTIERVISEYKRLRDEVTVFNKLKAQARLEIIEGYFDTKYGEIHTQEGIILAKYLPVDKFGIDQERFKEEQADLYRTYMVKTTYGKLDVL